MRKHRKHRKQRITTRRRKITDEREKWDILFEGMTPEQVANEISEVYLDPDFRLEVVRETS